MARLDTLLVFAAVASSACTFSLKRDNPTPSFTLQKAPFAVALAGKVRKSPAHKAQLKAFRGPASKTSKALVHGTDNDQVYLTDMSVGGQDFRAIIDTGSSDTWVPVANFSCMDLLGAPQPQSTCAFGPAKYNPAASSTFERYPDRNFNITYGSGEFLNGIAGFETITVGGLSVKRQEFGIVETAAFLGDTVSSGLLGLAYPNLTKIYPGADATKDQYNTQENYDPWFFTAVKEKKVHNSYFSLALNRGSPKAEENSTYDPHLGLLAFGGHAPVPITNTRVSVPVITFSPNASVIPLQKFWWLINIDAYVFPGSDALATNGSAFIDSGSTFNYLPTEIADAYNAAFDPPATFNETEDTYYVQCNATAPAFSVKIGGVQFAVSGKDNVVPSGTDAAGHALCMSGVQDGGPAVQDNVFILGDAFLHNVVASFDVVENMVHLAERVPY